ncbi:MAG: C_GCAxxG_C_C family protein [Victivallales bacterium]|nr:C_GCAxxG_C_C family protein [Victivallales bacterium]
MLIDKEREEASLIFRKPPRMLNCSQSVAAACGHDEMVDGLSGFGGGRAPEGMCGALYAAMAMVPEEKRAELRKRFAESVGNEACRDIKAVNKVPCIDCVATAIALAREIGKR